MTTALDIRPLAQEAQPSELQLVLDLQEAGLITSVSLRLENPEMSYETYIALGRFLGRVADGIRWWIGDWLLFGEGVFGERWSQALEATGLTEETLRRYMLVCENVPAEERRVGVPFGVHHKLAKLDPQERSRWLDQAESNGWTEKELVAALRAERALTEPPLPGLAPTEDIVNVARAVLRDARPADDAQHYLVPNETMARLRAVLGEEE